jgi:hypothetical protein
VMDYDHRDSLRGIPVYSRAALHVYLGQATRGFYRRALLLEDYKMCILSSAGACMLSYEHIGWCTRYLEHAPLHARPPKFRT